MRTSGGNRLSPAKNLMMLPVVPRLIEPPLVLVRLLVLGDGSMEGDDPPPDSGDWSRAIFGLDVLIAPASISVVRPQSAGTLAEQSMWKTLPQSEGTVNAGLGGWVALAMEV